MVVRAVVGALVAISASLSLGIAYADPLPAPSGATTERHLESADSSTKDGVPSHLERGVIVVASANAEAAARTLAREVYLDADLRPAIDEATARVLIGEQPKAGAPSRLLEIAAAREGFVTAQSDVVGRRLLASIGSDLGAALVAVVVSDGGRPVVRVLRTKTAAFQNVELGVTVEVTPNGQPTYRFFGAAAVLHGLLPPRAPLAPLAQALPDAVLTPAPTSAEPRASRPFWKSPWFWGPALVVVTAGVTMFAVSKAAGSSADVHLEGKVSP